MDCAHFNRAAPPKTLAGGSQEISGGIYMPVSEKMYNVSDYSPTNVRLENPTVFNRDTRS